MKKYFGRNLPLFFLIALLLPLFYINVKDSHDWGDDFAQYFIQARNILEGRSQTDNGLVFDRETGEYALKAYPAGFPLILATAWRCFGDSLVVSSITLSIFFFAFGVLSFFYFKKHFSEAASVLLALLIIYNPLTIGFKKEILSDIPFSFFLLLGILLFRSKKENAWWYILTGVVWGFALSVRGIGAALFLAAGFYILYKFLLFMMKKELGAEFFLSLRKVITVSISAMMFYFLLNAILFPIPSGGILQFYADAVRDQDFGKWIVLNSDYYKNVFLDFFSNLGGSLHWITAGTRYILFILIIPGIFLCWFRRPGFDDWLFLAYILVLFVYPYLGGGFRFLLPVMPLLLKYIFTAFNSLAETLRVTSFKPLQVFLLIILMQYVPGISDQVRSMDIPEQGPQGMEARSAFDYVNKLPPDAVVVFLKPRALAYYSNKRTAYVTRNIDPAALRGLFARMDAHYFLICHENDEVNDVLLKKFVLENKDRLRLIYRNTKFDLYTDKAIM